MALFPKTKTRSPNKTPPRRPNVTSYYRSESQPDQASPFTKKPPPRSARRYIFGFLDVIMIFVILLGIGYSSMIKPVPNVIVSDTSFHLASAYRDAAAANLKQLKNRNKITFNEKSLVASLQKQFPEIDSVQVELPFFSEQPTVRIAVGKPAFVLQNTAGSFVINTSGTAVTKAAKITNASKLTKIQDQSGFNVREGTHVLSANNVTFIQNLIAQCRLARVTISRLTLPPQPQEIYLNEAGQPYYVKFYLGGDVLTQAGQFLAARKNFTDSGQLPAQYLDVRIPGKIFYK